MADYLILNGNIRSSIEFKLKASKSCGSSSSSSTCEDNEYTHNQIKTEPVMIINQDDDYEDIGDDMTGSSKSSLVAVNANNQANRRKQNKPIRISNQEKELNNALLLKQKQQQLNEEESSTAIKHELSSETKKQDESPKIIKKIESDTSSHLNQTTTKAISSPSTTISDLLSLPNQQTSSSASNSKHNAMETFCTICRKEICNKYFLKTHLLNKHGVQIEDYLAASAAAAAVATLKQNQETEKFISGGLNSSNQADFCDLCQKQFCNKYYLKKHKLDVHGVNDLVKTIKDSNELISQASFPSSPVSKPLDTPSPCSSSSNQSDQQILEEKTNKSNQKQTNDSSNIIYNESFCEYCNKSFCNKYFLRTHMNKAHGKTLIIESNNTIINSSIDNELNDSNVNETNETHFASKVVDRVICDICNKQVCNKYFLRTHKVKVHGINEIPNQSTKSNQMKPDDSDQSQYNDYYDEDELEEGEQRKYNDLDEDDAQVVDSQTNKKELGEIISNKKGQTRKRKYSGNSSTSYRSSSLECVSSSDCDDAFDSNAKKTKYYSKSLEENTSNMQPFMIEYDNSDEDDQFGKFFMSCMIYLPVKSKLNDSISVRVKLRPMKNFINENESNIDKSNSKMTN